MASISMEVTLISHKGYYDHRRLEDLDAVAQGRDKIMDLIKDMPQEVDNVHKNEWVRITVEFKRHD